jgi:hypothetical protein
LKLLVDAESSLVDIAKEIAKRRSPATTLVNTTPTTSWKSKGAVEGYVHKLGDNCRALRSQLETLYGETIDNNHAMFTWLVPYASWLHNRFQPVGEQRRTPYEAVRGKIYDGPIHLMGSVVLIRPPDCLTRPKLTDRWLTGVGLGKTVLGDMHMVGTQRGVICARNVRAVPPKSPQDDEQVRKNMIWTTWTLRKLDWADVEPGEPRRPGVEQRVVDRSSQVLSKESFDEYLKEVGKTSWCRGCRSNDRCAVHSKRCLQQRQQWEAGKRRRAEEQASGSKQEALGDRTSKVEHRGAKRQPDEPPRLLEGDE